MTFNRKALWWTAAFVILLVLATNQPTVGIVIAVVSAVILDTLTWFSWPRRKQTKP